MDNCQRPGTWPTNGGVGGNTLGEALILEEERYTQIFLKTLPPPTVEFPEYTCGLPSIKDLSLTSEINRWKEIEQQGNPTA